MKNIILKVVFSISVLLLCASCSSSLRHSGEGASVNVAVNVKALEADVSVGDKITGTAKEAYLFGFFKTSSSGPSDYSHKVEVNSDEDDASSVSNREYEERLQDKKRQIKLLNKSFLPEFIEEFDILIRQ